MPEPFTQLPAIDPVWRFPGPGRGAGAGLCARALPALALLAVCSGPLGTALAAAPGTAPQGADAVPAVRSGAAAEALRSLQRAVLNGDRAAVARLSVFPLAINRPRERLQVPDAARFVQEYPAWISPPVRRALLAQNPSNLVLSPEGARIGRGELWLAPQCEPPACEPAQWRLVAINQARPAMAEATMGPDGRVAGPVAAAAVATAPAPMTTAPASEPGAPAVRPTPPRASAPTASPPAVVAVPAAPTAAAAQAGTGTGTAVGAVAAGVAPAATPAWPAAGPEASAAVGGARSTEPWRGFVNRVWRVSRSNTVEAGTLYAFLGDGTLVITSPNGTPGVGRWSFDGQRFRIVEMGRPYPVTMNEQGPDGFAMRVEGPGEPVEIDFEAANSR